MLGRQMLTLRIIGSYFLFSGIMTGFLMVYARTSSASSLAYSVGYLVMMVVIAVGMFRLFPWARYAAIGAFLVKIVQFEAGALRDIRMMNSHSVDLTATLVSVLMIVPVTALYIAAIWWLSRTATKEIFTRKAT
jgi:hypothetical protein